MVSARFVTLVVALSGGTLLLYYGSKTDMSKVKAPQSSGQNPSWFQIPSRNLGSSWFEKQVNQVESDDGICIPMEELVKAKPLIDQRDPRLINYIRSKQLIQNPSTEEYNLEQPDIDPSMGQSAMILKALKNMKNGFFVECGALDGETRSNTLFMEKSLGWSGLLIEGDPKNYKEVISKHRKAYTVNACLATHPYPHEVQFKQSFNIGRISEKDDSEAKAAKEGSFTDVQCFPFYSLLSAINITTVDYFSLDIEGDEMKVLRHLPFDEIFIKTISVEFIHGEGIDSLHEYMQEKGYNLLGKITHPNNLANDLLFIHNSIKN